MGNKPAILNTILLLSVFIMTASAPGRAETAGQQGTAMTPEQERLEKQKRVLEAMEKDRHARQQEKEQAGKERQEASAKCEKARQELTRRENAAYLYRKGKDGEPEVFTDEERARSTADAEAAVKKWCKQ